MAVVVVPIALAVPTVMALWSATAVSGDSGHHTKVAQGLAWLTVYWHVKALAWLVLSLAASCVAFQLFRTCAFVLGGCCSVLRTSKKVNSFLGGGRTG